MKHLGRLHSLSKTYGSKSSITGGNTYNGVQVTPKLRKWYGMPVDTEDPYQRVLPFKDDELVTKHGVSTAYFPTGGENDIGTQKFLDRTKGRRIDSRKQKGRRKSR